ncbi:hypothetical protein ABT151_38330, partial [Streptomyces bluensis]
AQMRGELEAGGLDAGPSSLTQLDEIDGGTVQPGHGERKWRGCDSAVVLCAGGPGRLSADIVEVGEHGLRRVEWQQLALVDHWRRYLDDPQAYLRHILG